MLHRDKRVGYYILHLPVSTSKPNSGGEGKPLPCLEVADRMIQVAPANTRVVDPLLNLKALDHPILDLHASLLSRWGLPPSDGNRNQHASDARPPSRRGLSPSDADQIMAGPV